MKVADLFAALGLKPDLKSFQEGNKLIEGIKTGLKSLVAIASVNWVKNQITQVADLGDKLDEMAQKTGVPVETLQELGYAASFSDVSLDAMGTSMGKLAKTMQGAAKGSKGQAKTFRDMGVAVKGADGKLRPMEDVLMDVADHVASLPDGAEKSALAMDVFGRSGRDLIPLLNEGGEGIRKLSDEANELGVVMSAQDAAGMAEFNDEVDKLGHAWQGVKILIAKELIPVIKKVVIQVGKWIKENRKLIASRIAIVLKLIATGFLMIAKAIGVVLDVMDELFRAWEGMKYAIGAVVAALLTFKAISIAAAAASTVAWIASLWPYALIVLAIAAVLLILQDLWTAFRGGPSVFKAIYDGAVEWLGESTFGKIFLDVIKAWTEGWKIMIDFWLSSLREVYQLAKDIFGVISKGIETLTNLASGDVTGAKKSGSALGKKIWDLSGASDVYGAGESLLQGDVRGAAGKLNNLIPGSSVRESIYDNTLGRFISYDPGQTQMNKPGQVITPSFEANFTINSQSGDPVEIRKQTRDEMEQFFDDKMREIDIGEGIEA